MGLIRKSLMVGTGGVVSGSSKKQKAAKAQLRELRQQSILMKEQMVMSQKMFDLEHPEIVAERKAAAEAEAIKVAAMGFWERFWYQAKR